MEAARGNLYKSVFIIGLFVWKLLEGIFTRILPTPVYFHNMPIFYVLQGDLYYNFPREGLLLGICLMQSVLDSLNNSFLLEAA